MSTQMLMHSKQPQVPFVDLAAQYRTIEREINEATSRVIQQTDFILGREVSLFEEEFAAFCEAKYTVGVDSGTSALELALRAFDIGPGDEVITAANSFIASALAISHVGRSEEHTSELQSLRHLVCRLLLEKKKHRHRDRRQQ